jgi:hypothetical protein
MGLSTPKGSDLFGMNELSRLALRYIECNQGNFGSVTERPCSVVKSVGYAFSNETKLFWVRQVHF